MAAPQMFDSSASGAFFAGFFAGFLAGFASSPAQARSTARPMRRGPVDPPAPIRTARSEPRQLRLRRAPTRRGAYSFGAFFAGSFLAAFFGGGGLMKASIFFASMLRSSRSPNLSRSFFCSASS